MIFKEFEEFLKNRKYDYNSVLLVDSIHRAQRMPSFSWINNTLLGKFAPLSKIC